MKSPFIAKRQTVKSNAMKYFLFFILPIFLSCSSQDDSLLFHGCKCEKETYFEYVYNKDETFSIALPKKFNKIADETTENNYGISASINNDPSTVISTNFFVNNGDTSFNVIEEESKLQEEANAIIIDKGEVQNDKNKGYWWIFESKNEKKYTFYIFYPNFKKNIDYAFMSANEELEQLKINICEIEHSLFSAK